MSTSLILKCSACQPWHCVQSKHDELGKPLLVQDIFFVWRKLKYYLPEDGVIRKFKHLGIPTPSPQCPSSPGQVWEGTVGIQPSQGAAGEAPLQPWDADWGH